MKYVIVHGWSILNVLTTCRHMVLSSGVLLSLVSLSRAASTMLGMYWEKRPSRCGILYIHAIYTDTNTPHMQWTLAYLVLKYLAAQIIWTSMSMGFN